MGRRCKTTLILEGRPVPPASSHDPERGNRADSDANRAVAVRLVYGDHGGETRAVRHSCVVSQLRRLDSVTVRKSELGTSL